MPKLTELADDRMAPKRALALRAPGWVGSPEAVRALRQRLVGQEAVLAAAALGMAAATGMFEPADAKAIVAELAAQYCELATRMPWLNVFGGCRGSDLGHVTAIARALPVT